MRPYQLWMRYVGSQLIVATAASYLITASVAISITIYIYKANET